MAIGSLALRVTDTLDEPVLGLLRIDLDQASESAGGRAAYVEFTLTGQIHLEISKLHGRDGPGTRYEARLTHDHFQTYAFFQVIVGNQTTAATDSPIPLAVKPSAVSDIMAPDFEDLPSTLRRFLEAAQMAIGPHQHRSEDEQLMGLVGEPLYLAMGPLRTACVLNLFAKARHVSSARCWNLFNFPIVVRQDRFFCDVDRALTDLLQGDPHFKSAPSTLHKPLAGYTIVDSFKSKDTHANIQVTVMRDDSNGRFAADVDIDEASGIEHGFEVLRNKFRGRTNPYLVRELLLLADVEKGGLYPGYRFVLRT